MNLSDRQQVILAEMGIPLWQARSNSELLSNEHTLDAVSMSCEHHTIEFSWAVVVEQATLSPEAERLLSSILLSIGLTYQELTLIYCDSSHQISLGSNQKCCVLVFGQQHLSNMVLDEGNILIVEENSSHHTYSDNITLLSFPELTDLIKQPTLKKYVWHSLSTHNTLL